MAAASTAGCLGTIAAGYLTPALLRKHIREVKGLADRPFGEGIFARGNGFSSQKLGQAAHDQMERVGEILGVEIKFNRERTADRLIKRRTGIGYAVTKVYETGLI